MGSALECESLSASPIHWILGGKLACTSRTCGLTGFLARWRPADSVERRTAGILPRRNGIVTCMYTSKPAVYVGSPNESGLCPEKVASE